MEYSHYRKQWKEREKECYLNALRISTKDNAELRARYDMYKID